MTWRKEPPTVDEVRACPWWWVRSGLSQMARDQPYVLHLEVENGQVEYADNYRGALDPADYINPEWAPCVLPAEAP